MTSDDSKSRRRLKVFQDLLRIARKRADQRQERAVQSQERRWVGYGVAVMVIGVLSYWRDVIVKAVVGLFK